MRPFAHHFRLLAFVVQGPTCFVRVFEELQMDLHFDEDRPG